MTTCRAFKKMDDVGDGDRRLQVDEFVNGFLASEELDMDKDTLTALFHQIDATGRGNINFREFYAALKVLQYVLYLGNKFVNQ